MNKKIFALIAVLGLLFAASPALASKSADDSANLPEEEGTYDVPNRPNMKLRVFVYHGKPAEKPGKPAPTPLLVCGLSDIDSNAVVALTGWKLPADWNYSLNVSSVPNSVDKTNIKTIAANSFSQWTGALGGKVAITELATTTTNRQGFDGKNIITWGRASASALAITYTWYYPDTGLVAEVDTVMNSRYVWKWSDPSSWSPESGKTCAYTNAYDAQDILTHELGHWFGLNDHYTGEYANNTMYGYGSMQETKKDTITSGDAAGLNSIYQ